MTDRDLRVYRSVTQKLLFFMVHAHGTASPAGRFLHGNAGFVMQSYIDLHDGVGQLVAQFLKVHAKSGQFVCIGTG